MRRMDGISEKIADVTRRIADSKARIVEEQERIAGGGCAEAAISALRIYSASCAVRELRAHKARLEDFIGVNTR